MLKGYMKDRAAMFGCLLICYGTLFLIGYLYDIPFEKTRYIAEFSGAGVFLCLLVDILKYAERWKELKRCIATSDTYPGMFYTVPGDLEALYRSMIAKMRQEKEELIFEDQKRYTEMMDYYGMWAHQIKTPIAAMKVLAQAAGDTEDARTYELLQDMQTELFKTEQYVEIVLTYVRMEDMSGDLMLKEYALDNLVKQALKKYSRMFAMQKLALHYEALRVTVTTDEKWLVFVLEQILSNAIKYSGENHAVTIHINRNEADNTCEFVISDQGIGIRKEDLPRIFEKGYTGYNGRADKTSTGIGLYLCREITKKLGHGIMITSEIGKGTDVTIVFERNNLDVRD